MFATLSLLVTQMKPPNQLVLIFYDLVSDPKFIWAGIWVTAQLEYIYGYQTVLFIGAPS